MIRRDKLMRSVDEFGIVVILKVFGKLENKFNIKAVEAKGKVLQPVQHT